MAKKREGRLTDQLVLSKKKNFTSVIDVIYICELSNFQLLPIILLKNLIQLNVNWQLSVKETTNNSECESQAFPSNQLKQKALKILLRYS